jgi:hypothetical protein
MKAHPGEQMKTRFVVEQSACLEISQWYLVRFSSCLPRKSQFQSSELASDPDQTLSFVGRLTDAAAVRGEGLGKNHICL